MTNTFSRLFRLSLYAAICLATIGLWMGEDDALPYPWLVIFCVIAAYAFTDVWGLLKIPTALHPWLAVAVVAFFVREELAAYKVDPVMPLGHLIMFFQIILLFHTKTQRTDWLLLLTCFLQMLMGALHNNHVTFGILMGLFLVLIVWTMTQFLLVRDSDRHGQWAVQHPLRFGFKRSLAGSLGSSLVIFLAAMLLFLLIPRRGQTAWAPAAHRPGQYITGFDEQIRLGQLGTILESDEEVMTVRMYDEQGEPYRPQQEPYWRGVALTHYESGRWERRVDIEPHLSPWIDRVPERYVRQEVRLQGVHRDVLFGIWPAFRGYTRAGKPLGKVRRDGSLIRPEEAPAGAMQYIVESVPDGQVRLTNELVTRRVESESRERLNELREVPHDLTGPLQEYVARHGLMSNPQWEQICVAVLRHLQNPNEFGYTLHASVADPTKDPVLDFLLNRKEGHCEYFASAMTLLLRTSGVPARVVNGFKGGDWNEIFGPSIIVRQKHAHSWVEALVPVPGGQDLYWITLDPTPGQGRQQAVAMVNPTPSILRQVSDVSRQIWSNYVLNFNSGEQELAVYGPMRRLVVDHGRNLLRKVKEAWATPGRQFNWLAAIAASLAMLLLLAAMRFGLRFLFSLKLASIENPGNVGPRGFLGRFADMLRSILARWASSASANHPRIDFYERLLEHLDSFGLSKKPAWTAMQLAHFAKSEFDRRLPATAVASIPFAIVDRYYRVRFGRQQLSAAEAREIERLLDQLGEAVRSVER
jgi:hypothetical protein